MRKLNAAIAAGKLKNRGGQTLSSPMKRLWSARRLRWPIRSLTTFRMMLIDEAIPLDQLPRKADVRRATSRLRRENDLMAKTIFKRIIDGEIPAKIIYQDDRCLAFHDVTPQAPTHVLVIPKKEIASLAELTGATMPTLIGHIWHVIPELARQLNLADGYRIVVNCGPDAGQSVDHLHFHLLGGRPMTWPPG